MNIIILPRYRRQSSFGVLRVVCGGFKCIKPGMKNKNEKSQKCGLGDTFMQCVYQKIDTKVGPS